MALQLELETLAISKVADGIFHVELNRPKNRNAMNWAFWTELKIAYDAIAVDPECHVVILSGRGKSFTAGLDLTDSKNLPPPAKDAARRGLKFISHLRTMQDGISAVEACLKPTIAIVHGACIGGGVDLITATDVRYCTEDAIFSIREVAVGLAADVGTLARLPKVVSNDSAIRELAFTASDFGAEDALRWGLVSRVLPSMEKAMEQAQLVATRIAAQSPVAVLGTKRNLNYGRDHSIGESLEYIQAWNAAMIQTDDIGAAMTASFKKSTPQFSKL
mmetsp:Transcript_51948/g.96087  ORF Transcript_51948/g.96087 Transcript_51948/m.96087 type:complete len:276 (-) Transcript_51948:66-893(-)